MFGPGIAPEQLQPVAELVRGTEHAVEGHEALQQMFLKRFSPFRGLPLPLEIPARPDDPRSVLRRLKETRAELPTAQETYGAVLEQQGNTFGKLVKAEAAAIMSKTEFKFKAADYELTSGTLDAARSAAQVANRKMTEHSEALEPFERLCVDRLISALRLLEVASISQRIDDADGWRREVHSLYPVAASLSQRVWPRLMPMAVARAALLTVLQNYQGNEQNTRLTNAILRGGQILHDRLQELNTALAGGLLYPFDHASGRNHAGPFRPPFGP